MLGAQSTLESNYWFGAQGNRLWVGLVEGDGNRLIGNKELIDLSGSNRVKVRIMGYHTRSRDKLKPEELPWASVMIPATESVTTSNVGITHGLAIGQWVLGTFMDGESAQSPLVLGSLGLVDEGPTPDGKYNPIAGGGSGQDDLNAQETGVVNTTGSLDTGSGQSARGASNLGELASSAPGDIRARNGRNQTLAIPNGKCGNRAESEFGRILQDLFKFIGANDRVGDVLVDRLTGNITTTASLITNYGGRLINSVNNLLGGVKALVVREVKKFLQTTFTGLLAAIQTPNGRGAASTIAIKSVKDFIMEAVKCLFQAVLAKVVSLIIEIVTKLIDDVLNTAFCQISNILKSIVSTIQDAIGIGLQQIGKITSIISDFGNFGGSFIAKLGKLIAQFCDGQLSCAMGLTSYTTGVGAKSDNSVYDFFDRLELFGGLPNEVNTGLYGSDSFLKSIDNIKLRDSDGNIVTGTLDCNKVTQFQWPMIPNIFFTGILSELNKYTLDISDELDYIKNTYGPRNPNTGDRGLPVTIGGSSVGIGGKNTNPVTLPGGGFITIGGSGGRPISYGGTGGTPLIIVTDNNTEVPVIIDNIPILVGSTGGTPVTVDGVSANVGAVGGIPVKYDGENLLIIGEQSDRTEEQIFNDNPYPQPIIDGKNPSPTAIPAINSAGQLVSVKVTNPGFGLKTPPNITIFPVNDWGSGAQGFTTLNSSGGLKCVYVTRQGGGYPYFDVSVSTSNFVKLLPNGQPDYAKIAGIYTENPFWLGILTNACPPVVTATGSDYDETTRVIVEPGDGEVAEVVLPELKPILEQGRLVGIEVVKEGFGFTNLPKIYLQSSNGTIVNDRKAVIRPVVDYIPRENAKDLLTSYEEFREIIDCVGYPGD